MRHATGGDALQGLPVLDTGIPKVLVGPPAGMWAGACWRGSRASPGDNKLVASTSWAGRLTIDD